jgi:predicted DNA-binding transcriptional regulator YafY
MRRADRLFDIVQILRAATRPVTAGELAARLEVTVRTIYRDVAALQAGRLPIEGAAGVGYVLRRGFDLPPLMFTPDELDAISIGGRLVRRLRDSGLQRAADSVLAKVAGVLPESLRAGIAEPLFFVSEGSAVVPEGITLTELRLAIRDHRKIRIGYVDAVGVRTERTVWPLAMAYYVDVTLLGGWCELRGDLRSFRVDRIAASAVLDEGIPESARRLLGRWLAQQADNTTAGDGPAISARSTS